MSDNITVEDIEEVLETLREENLYLEAKTLKEHIETLTKKLKLYERKDYLISLYANGKVNPEDIDEDIDDINRQLRELY